MLNWTDLSVLVMLVAGPLSGLCAALQHKAGIAWLLLFTIIGLGVGIGLSAVSRKLAYSILRSKTMPTGLQFFGHMFVPMVFLFAVLLVPALLANLML